MTKDEQIVNKVSLPADETGKFGNSNDENLYRKFSVEIASRVVMNNKSESVDVLIDALKNSKYYKGI